MVHTTGTLRVAWVLCIVLAFAWSCSDPPVTNQHETECDNGLDDDGDTLVDCNDIFDCGDHSACQTTDGDADTDSDGDSDSDTDSDGDSDTDSDSDSDPTCERDCASEYQLRTICQVGDCYASGLDRDCCVAEESICHTLVTVGEMYTDLDVDYRGFYSNEHQCGLRIMDSAGDLNMIFELQTRGLACEYGFILVRLRAHVDEIVPGTPYRLCEDDALPNMQLVVNVGEGSTDQTNYYNLECEGPGTFVVTELGDETGEGYAFHLEGRLQSYVSGRPSGEFLDISINSSGLVVVETEPDA
jgi:hypothetical protein